MPARTATTSSAPVAAGPSEGEPTRSSAGLTARMRRDRSRAVPDGRSVLPCRCHSTTYGSYPGRRAACSAASSTRRAKTRAPGLKLAAATAAAPEARSTSATPCRSSSQAVVAITNRRTPPSTPACRLARTALPRDASTTRSTRWKAARPWTPAAGRPATRTAAPCPARASATARPNGPSPRMSARIEMSSASVLVARGPSGKRRAGSPSGESKSRGHQRCRGPRSLRSLEAPGRRLRAPSEPQGPCLPAGPPELLLRLGREEVPAHLADLTRVRRFTQPFPAAPPGVCEPGIVYTAWARSSAAERGTFNPCVLGSNPSGLTTVSRTRSAGRVGAPAGTASPRPRGVVAGRARRVAGSLRATGDPSWRPAICGQAGRSSLRMITTWKFDPAWVVPR